LVISGVASDTAWSATDEDPKATIQSPSYHLVMSDNDTICKPLTGLYNKLLRRDLESTNLPFNTAYEASNFDEFEKIGFHSPKVLVGSLRDGFYLQSANIYNNGISRTILGRLILRKYLDYTTLDLIYDSVPLDTTIKYFGERGNEGNFSDIVERSLGPSGKPFELKTNKNGPVKFALFRKWPNLASIARYYQNLEPNYIIHNQYETIYRKTPRSIVVIYKVLVDETQDVCYIYL
jgi:hypothetical protein